VRYFEHQHEGGIAVKILAKFLLSSVFVFLPAVGGAQDTLGIHDSCGFAPALKGFTVETSVWINNKLIEEVSPQIVEMLEDRVNCLNDNMMQLNASVKSLQSPLISNENLTTDILLLQDKLKQAELDRHTAETKIEDLEASLHLIERRLAMAEDEIEWLTPKPSRIQKAPANKPKAPASKPTAPASKPTPAVKEGTH
jgi:peptidoglycan hydrolase CwlO-like protein